MASSGSADRHSAHSSVQGWNPQQVNTPPQYLGRKTLPIKRADAAALTREDIQYDLLYFIFADPTRAFVDYMAPGKPLVNFCDLYVNALFNSNKCSKVLKDKMVETPEFAIEFAKIALLTNVGRINTTMAFFPEMKTALRSYHPVPSLQKSDGNLQDAPRIKNCLKASLLPFEFKTPPPSTPTEILERVRAGNIPPTSVVNLIFVLANSNHALQLAQAHFEAPVEFLDLFLPVNISSVSRAKAFLWMIYHYLSDPDDSNPFDDDYSRANPGRAPRMLTLSQEDMMRENQDPADEIDWGKRMSAMRIKFLKELVEDMEVEKKEKNNPPTVVPPVATTSSSDSLSAEDLAAARRSRAHPPATSTGDASRGSSYGHGYSAAIQQPVPRARGFPQPQADPSREGQAQERSMLEQAWHVVTTTDPLEDSDIEGDENVKLDYNRRLRILSRLRGKDVTPPPADQQSSTAGGTSTQFQPFPQFQPPYQGPSVFNRLSQSGSSSQESTGKLRQVNWNNE